MSSASQTQEVTLEQGLAAARPASGTSDLISSSALKWGIGLFLVYFAARLLFLAASVSSYVPPDEITHAGLCQLFSKVLLLPGNSPDSYDLGLVTNTPWLYYWVMGKLLHLNIFALPDLFFLRLVNIPFAFGTIYYSWRLLKLVTEDRLTQLLLVVALSNLPMLSLLSASVSYDNMANFLAALATYYMFAFFRSNGAGLLAVSLIAQMTGALTKITMPLLALLLELLLLVHLVRQRRACAQGLAAFVKGAPLRALLAALLLFAGLSLNLQLYAGNYLHYGTLTPSMAQVLSPAAAMQNRIGARDTIFRDFAEGKISYMDALEKAGEIKHVGDKSDTFFLLMNYQGLKQNPALWMGLPQYALLWCQSMVGTIFGIKGHLFMGKDPGYLVPLYLLFAAAVAGLLLRWRPRHPGTMTASLAALAISFAGYLMYKVNYSSYLFYGTPGPTLHGRYLFTVLAPVSVLFCHYLLSLCRVGSVRVLLALCTAVIFIWYDFPWFLTHATAQWFSWPPQ